MNKDDVLKLENQLCFSMYATSRAITKLYRPLLDELDITYPQYLVMLVLWEFDSISLKDLGIRLQLDSGTLTPLVKRLESMDLLKRERSSTDERILNVSITEKGTSMKVKAQSIPECIMSKLSVDENKLVKLKREVDELLGVLTSDE